MQEQENRCSIFFGDKKPPIGGGIYISRSHKKWNPPEIITHIHIKHPLPTSTDIMVLVKRQTHYHKKLWHSKHKWPLIQRLSVYGWSIHTPDKNKTLFVFFLPKRYNVLIYYYYYYARTFLSSMIKPPWNQDAPIHNGTAAVVLRQQSQK